MNPTGPTLPPPNWQNQPPPVYFPPPMFYPPPASRGGFARAIFTTLAVSILGFSLTLNLYLLIVAGIFGSSDSPGIAQETIDAGGNDVVAIIPIEGLITGRAAGEFEKVLKHVGGDPTVKALVIEIDSPGGEVTASDEIYQRIVAFKNSTKIPVVVSMQGIAASGGYYIACAADYVVAQRTTITGSIGVYSESYNFSKLMEKYGVEDTTVVSSGSKFKRTGVPTREFTEEMKLYVQSHVDTNLALFKSVIAAGRNLKPEAVDTLATGEIFSGADALGLKLVDQLGFREDAIAVAESRAGLSGARVIRFTKEVTFLDALAGVDESSALEAQVGSTTLKVDKKLLSELTSPRPMFLYRGH